MPDRTRNAFVGPAFRGGPLFTPLGVRWLCHRFSVLNSATQTNIAPTSSTAADASCFLISDRCYPYSKESISQVSLTQTF